MSRVLRRLILAEKFSAARRLAQILSEGMAEKVRADVSSYFTWSDGGDDVIVFPLRGRIVEIDYPESARDWAATDLDALVDLEPIRQESPPALHDALRGLADSIDEVVLATDYDREGELIGVEALETIRHKHPDLPARRARFSAMPPSEVRRAFENLVEPDWTLAEAAAAPFNTTSFLAHASRLGHSASRAMAAAQESYVRGEISYPRTDNTVYPPSLPVREILDRLRKSPYQDYVERLLERPELEASHGPIHTTDHPPIHPTAAPAKRRAGVRASVYDMIARRFLATLSPPSLSTITEVHLRVGDTEFVAVGQATVEPGWREILPEDRKVTDLPPLREDEELAVREVRIVEDHTMPPSLHTQGTLLLAMQRLGLGTKSTRHEILDLLFRRQYVSGRSIRTTAAGRALVDALTIYGPDVTDPGMTQHLEDRMTAIAEGREFRASTSSSWRASSCP